MRNRPCPRAVSLIVLAALLLAACAPPSDAPPTGEPVVLRIGMAGSPDPRNPGNAWLIEAFDLFELTYDALVYIDFAGNYHPKLAERWTASDDGLTWTFTLRDGVKFADGTPLTAEDVAFSLLAYRDWEAFGFISGYTTHFADVQPTDERTVVLTLDASIANLESQLLFCYILPKHIWEPYAGDRDAAKEFENAEMIGSGPFRLVEFRQGEYHRLAANKDTTFSRHTSTRSSSRPTPTGTRWSRHCAPAKSI